MRVLPKTTLADVCESVRYGYTASASADVCGPRFLRITDIVPDSVDWESVPYCEIEDADKQRYTLHVGDIVVARTGATVGYARLIREPVEAVFASYLVRFRVDVAKADPGYVGRLVESQVYKTFVQSRIGGAAQPNASAPVLGSFEFPLPPIPTQSRIASLLSAYDDLIENNNRRITLLEQAARLLYEEWFVRLRFPGREHTRIVDGVPKGWKRVDLVSACVPGIGIQTGPFGSQLHQSDYADDGIPVVMPKDIINSRISTVSIARVPAAVRDRLPRHVMQTGDIVLARRGNIGRKAFVGDNEAGWMCGTGCMRLRPNTEAVRPRFLFATLGRADVIGMIAGRAQGAIMPNLNLGIMADVPIIVPPMQLQREFGDVVEPIHEMIAVLDQQNQKACAARDLLLPRLMSGEIAV